MMVLPLSPKSCSGGARTCTNTPDLALVREDMSCGHFGSSEASPPVAPQASNSNLDVRGTAEQDKDPFVTLHRSSMSSLSPTAVTFQPVNIQQQASLGPGYANGLFSHELGLSRSLVLSTSGPTSLRDTENLLTNLNTNDTCYGSQDLEEREGHVMVHFSDIRDAYNTINKLKLHNQTWAIQYLNEQGITSVSSEAVFTVTVIIRDKSTPHADVLQKVHESINNVRAIFAFKILRCSDDDILSCMVEFCDKTAFATVMKDPEWEYDTFSLTLSPYNSSQSFVGYATAMQPDQAARLAPKRNWPYSQPCEGTERAFSQQSESQITLLPVIFRPSKSVRVPFSLDSVMSTGLRTHITPQGFGRSSYSSVCSPFHSPPSPTLTAPGNFSPPRFQSSLERIDLRRQTAARATRSTPNSVGHHNFVDVKRIRDGIDVRTTIMLRNIPNKVDQAMLKRLIDESSWGKYDFMYLRIDFANNCNVGYAFINFVDPLDIINFVHTRGNQRWNCFKSDKVAEISYATIQGKDCLVQKFRNSSVMLEAAHYRPKLYFTSNGPMPDRAGEEEEFPEPDNQSKMKRSCENAEHVGLFTPNAGQQYRDELRRRRSQYDRGTRLAALEEHDYSSAMQQLYVSPK